MYGGESSHLPLKINTAGVIQQFCLSATIITDYSFKLWFCRSDNFLKISSMFTQGQPLYMLLYASGIIFFFFLYINVFNKRNSRKFEKIWWLYSRNKARQRTAEYIESILIRLTTVGSLYLTFVCLMPEFLIANILYLFI